MGRRWRKSTQVRCYIDVSAFVSVMIVLLWMYMAALYAPHVPYPPLHRSVELAKTNYDVRMKDARREDALIVSVTRDGQIYFEISRLSPKDLSARIRERVQAGAPSTVYLNVDARAHYGAVSAVVDSIHDAGVEKIGLITEPRHRSDEAIFSR